MPAVLPAKWRFALMARRLIEESFCFHLQPERYLQKLQEIELRFLRDFRI